MASENRCVSRSLLDPEVVAASRAHDPANLTYSRRTSSLSLYTALKNPSSASINTSSEKQTLQHTEQKYPRKSPQNPTKKTNLGSPMKLPSARSNGAKQQAVYQQAALEKEMVSKEATIEQLQTELRGVKQKKQAVDNELAQYTADYMNSQARWIEQVDGLNKEIQKLKSQVLQSNKTNAATTREIVRLREELSAEIEAKNKAKYRANHHDKVQRNVDGMEHHQNEIRIMELRAVHARLKQELEEVKLVNDRLSEENEHFQYLVIERTITGLPENGSSMTGGSLADEEVFDFSQDEVKQDNAEKIMDGKADTQSDTQVGSQSSTTNAGISEGDADLKKLIIRQKFELRSLQNHNTALKQSLERLVDRMLDNRNFAVAVEEAVSKLTVHQFRNRVASYTDTPTRPSASSRGLRGPPNESQTGPTLFLPPIRRPTSTRNSSQSDRNSVQTIPRPSKTWSNMIFNSHLTGNPNRRAFSEDVESASVEGIQGMRKLRLGL